MRPPSRASSFFYHPLDAVLGTPAAIRILRVLSLHRDVMSAPMLAERTGVTVSGVHRALKWLVDAKALEPVGDPRRPHYRLSPDSPLIAQLATLFEAEAARTDLFMQQLRDAAAAVEPPPDAIWLIGSVARGEDSMMSDVDVAMVWRGMAHPGLKTFNRAIHEAGNALGLQVSMLTLTTSDVTQHARANDAWWQNLLADAVPIVGPAPQQLIDG